LQNHLSGAAGELRNFAAHHQIRDSGDANAERSKDFHDALDAEAVGQSNLIRDIFGNPFRSIFVDSTWLTPTVVAIATAIYEDRAFDRLPILADALEEAGCTNADVLLHCRQPGEHVRGCWVVDLVQGKG